MSGRVQTTLRARYVKLSCLKIIVLFLFLTLLSVPDKVFATHFPNGAVCLDCHTISATKMVPGSHLIRKSARTVKLGYTTGASTPCLFCHDWSATAIGENQTTPQKRMRGVWDHFSGASLSKHRIDIAKSLVGENNSEIFECVDCHSNISGGVVSGSNIPTPNVHILNDDVAGKGGYDASTEALPVEKTLIGNPSDLSGAAISQAVCLNSKCHGGVADNAYGTRNAPKAHSFTKGTSLNDGSTPTACTDCHGKHNSYQNAQLIVLRDDGTTKNFPDADDPGYGISLPVTPDKCGECHDFDDGMASSSWMTKGHGGDTYTGNTIGLLCESCHLASKPHDFTSSDKRFSFSSDASVSSVTGKSLRSICTVCHQGFSTHKGKAGCLDCHEPHGDGVGENIMMIREQIPVDFPMDFIAFRTSGKYDITSDPDVVINYDYYREYNVNDKIGAVDDTYNPPPPPNPPDPDNPPAPQTKNSSLGICDNYDCHAGKLDANSNKFWSLNYYFFDAASNSSSSQHLGGGQRPGGNCQGCHKHNDETGAWGASEACDDCHGYPPTKADPYADNPDAVGVHETHAVKIGYSCWLCHFNDGSGVHNKSKWQSNTGAAIDAANVDVKFDPVINPEGTYDKGTNQCLNLTCHNPDDPEIGLTQKGYAGQQERSAPIWIDEYKTTESTEQTRNGYPANTGNWEIGDAGEECEACHINSVLVGSRSEQPDGGAHFAHENPTFPQKNYPCTTCHATENSADNLYSAEHARGSLTDPALINFDLSKVGLPTDGSEQFSNSDSACANVYCHGYTLGNGGTNISPVWTDTSTGDCGACHGVQGVMASDPAKEASSGNHPTHFTADYGPKIPAGHGGVGCNNCHNSVDAANPSQCPMCHPSGWNPPGVTVAQGAKAPGGTTPSPTHVDGKVDFIGDALLPNTTACDNCHSLALIHVDGMDESVGDVSLPATSDCKNCHSTPFAGASSAVDLAKAHWSDAVYKTPCLNCHNQTDPANSKFDGSGVDAPAKDQSFAATGHGLGVNSAYGDSGRTGAGAECADCHDETSNHFTYIDPEADPAPNPLEDEDRLKFAGNQLCNNCHDGTDDGPGLKSTVRVSTHANTSSTYSALELPFELNCIECHDAHGSGNSYMINEVNPGGGLEVPRKLNGVDNYSDFLFYRDLAAQGSVAFSAGASGAVYATAESGDATKICQTCHVQTGHYQNNSASEHGLPDCPTCHKHDLDDDYASFDGFMPKGCNVCHGGAAGQFWPTGPNVGGDDSTPNNSGVHEAHIRWLADYVYGETITGEADNDILVDDATNNPGLSSVEKQMALCEYCHQAVVNDGDHGVTANLPAEVFPMLAPAKHYWDGAVDADAVYDSASTYTCSNVDCHFDGAAPTPSWYAPGPIPCTSCHTGAPSGTGSHVPAAYADCTDCHPGGATFPLRHSTNPKQQPANPEQKVVEIAAPPASWDNPGTSAAETWNMQIRLGLRYKIHLGGEKTIGQSEAEICWNCHGAGPGNDAVNEWGFNADTNGPDYPFVVLNLEEGSPAHWDNPGGSSYNYGWIYDNSDFKTTPTADWTGSDGNGAYLRDAYQHTLNSTLSRRIISVHSATFDGGAGVSSVADNVDAAGILIVPGALEDKKNIRCSYCHDVHDLNRAEADASSDRPYLRGSWMGNPYPPDMPPLDGYSFPLTGGPGPSGFGNRFSGQNLPVKVFAVATPRLYAYPYNDTAKGRGGYYIDSNSTYPTNDPNYNDLVKTAGLCTLCHGSDVDNMDYYSGSNLWRGVNGHSNSTLGGNGSNNVDLFDAMRGAFAQDWFSDFVFYSMGQQNLVNPGDWVYSNAMPVTFAGIGLGLRGWMPFKSDGMYQAGLGAGPGWQPMRNSGWYGGQAGSVNQGSAYASWYVDATVGNDPNLPGSKPHNFPCSKCHSPHAAGLPALLITNCLDAQKATWSFLPAGVDLNGNPMPIGPLQKQANNCHRKEAASSGWNKLAPSQ